MGGLTDKSNRNKEQGASVDTMERKRGSNKQLAKGVRNTWTAKEPCVNARKCVKTVVIRAKIAAKVAVN